MSLKNLSDDELVSRIEFLRGKERQVVLKFLIHLGELDDRRLYLNLGYSSLFDYCTRKLGYSESAAYRRIESSRTLRIRPELAESFIKGEVSICTIATASKALKNNKIEVKEILGKSKSEVEGIVAPLIPVAKPMEKIKEIKVQSEPVNLPLLPPVEVESRYEIKFSLTKEAYQKFQEATAKLSNKLSSDLSVEGVVTELLNQFMSDNKPRERKVVNINSRYIPTSVRWEVRKRDNCQCSFISDDGVRCTEKRYLHLDHIKPFALGGKSTTDNLRLLCAAHNLKRARETFRMKGYK